LHLGVDADGSIYSVEGEALGLELVSFLLLSQSVGMGNLEPQLFLGIPQL
jgi:hypothetical protein